MSDFVLCALCVALIWLVQTYGPALLPIAGAVQPNGSTIVALSVGELWDATGQFSENAILGRGVASFTTLR